MVGEEQGGASWICPRCATAFLRATPCPACGVDSVPIGQLRLETTVGDGPVGLVLVGYLEHPLDEGRVVELMESRRIALTVRPATGELLTEDARAREARQLLEGLRRELLAQAQFGSEALVPSPGAPLPVRIVSRFKRGLARGGLSFLEAVSWTGLGGSLLASGSAFLGSAALPGLAGTFFIGGQLTLFGLALLAGLVINVTDASLPERDFKRDWLESSPPWLRRLLKGLAIYAGLSVPVVAVLFGTGMSPAHTAVAFYSGLWMAGFGLMAGVFRAAASHGARLLTAPGESPAADE